jgi:hypothetical protein
MYQRRASTRLDIEVLDMMEKSKQMFESEASKVAMENHIYLNVNLYLIMKIR